VVAPGGGAEQELLNHAVYDRQGIGLLSVDRQTARVVLLPEEPGGPSGSDGSLSGQAGSTSGHTDSGSRRYLATVSGTEIPFDFSHYIISSIAGWIIISRRNSICGSRSGLVFVYAYRDSIDEAKIRHTTE